MANISLEASIRTCKVNTGWANRMESDRFFNSNEMMCPVWNGYNSKGQPVCADSFMTKREGCNSASDRVIVENAQRPQYAEYINLDAEGIKGNFYGNNMTHYDLQQADSEIDNTHNITGQFGYVTGFKQNVYPSCINSSVTPYDHAMAEEAKSRRQMQAFQNGYNSNKYRQISGF